MPANTEHPVVKLFQPPDANLKIWRYLDLPKLIDLLETKTLRFARADTLGDPFEGSWTRLNIDDRSGQIQMIISDTEANHNPEDINQSFQEVTHFRGQTIFVNCWHAGETESAAMWRQYGTSSGSVVIQSTYKKFVELLPSNIYVGLVQYKDYNSQDDYIPSGNLLYPIIHKRKEFAYENEVRAFLWSASDEPNTEFIRPD